MFSYQIWKLLSGFQETKIHTKILCKEVVVLDSCILHGLVLPMVQISMIQSAANMITARCPSAALGTLLVLVNCLYLNYVQGIRYCLHGPQSIFLECNEAVRASFFVYY